MASLYGRLLPIPRKAQLKKKAVAPNPINTGVPNVTTTVVERKKRPLWLTAIFALIGLCVVLGVFGALAGPPKPTTNTGLSSAIVSTLAEATNTSVPQAPPIQPTPRAIDLTPIPAKPTPTFIEPPVFQVPTETAAPPAPPVPEGPGAIGGGNYTAEALVDQPTPSQNANVRLTGRLRQDGQPVYGAVMNSTWNYKTTETPCDGAKTKADGRAGCSNTIGRAASGYKVVINVSFLVDGKQVATAQTSFTPK